MSHRSRHRHAGPPVSRTTKASIHPARAVHYPAKTAGALVCCRSRGIWDAAPALRWAYIPIISSLGIGWQRRDGLCGHTAINHCQVCSERYSKSLCYFNAISLPCPPDALDGSSISTILQNSAAAARLKQFLSYIETRSSKQAKHGMAPLPRIQDSRAMPLSSQISSAHEKVEEVTRNSGAKPYTT